MTKLSFSISFLIFCSIISSSSLYISFSFLSNNAGSVIKSIVISSDKTFYNDNVCLSFEDKEVTFYYNSSIDLVLEFYNTSTLEDYTLTSEQRDLIEELANELFEERQKEIQSIKDHNEVGF